MSALLPETREADDALTLVRTGVLRGLSVKFRAVRERFEAGVRIISRAELPAFSLVAKPAYADSRVSVRSALDDDLRYTLWL